MTRAEAGQLAHGLYVLHWTVVDHVVLVAGRDILPETT
jgi:hypothetical protein